MSKLKNLMTGAMALSLVAVPAVAQAADASKLSVSKARVGSVAKGERQEEGSSGANWIVPVLGAAAVIGGIVIIASGDDDADSN